MTHKSIAPALRAAGLALLAGAILGTSAFAQRPGPPPGGPFGGPGRPFGGPGGPGGFGGPGRGMRGPRPSSLANTPLAALSTGLKLTGAQKSKIGAIQAQYRAQRPPMMPPPGGPPPPPRPGMPGGPGRPGGPGMRGGMDGMRGLTQKADSQIKGVLTSSQKAALPGLIKTLDDLRFAGIPLETYGDLKLSAGQKAQIAGFVQAGQQTMRKAFDQSRQSGDFGAIREAMRTGRDHVQHQALSVLTAAQKATVSRYKAAHPQEDRGGFGGPPPGRGFGPPPPGGRFGGPPPPRR